MSGTTTSSVAENAPHPTSTLPVRDVMRHGLVLCDADVSVRDVARTMRDQRVRRVLAVDISGEAIGLIDESALARGWQSPDVTTAGDIMDPDPLIADPAEQVADVARQMLAAGVTAVLVAPPPPAEESGRWSEWKERGLPLGTLSVGDILARIDELGAVVRAAPPRQRSVGGRAAPWLALASLVVVAVLAGLLILAYVHGTHQYTNKPGL